MQQQSVKRTKIAIMTLVPLLAGLLFLTRGALAQVGANSELTAVGSSFLYQGELAQGGTVVDGIYDFRFIVYNAEVGGSQVGSTVQVDDVSVNGGRFTVQLDFGSGVFNGNPRWLEVQVKPDASGTYSTLAPRQPLLPSPYAVHAGEAATAPWSGITSIPADIADGDDDTTYVAGNGLTLGGTTFSVNYGGSGSAATVARSDHDHLGQTWNGSSPLVITGTYGLAPLVLGNNSPFGDGVYISNSNQHGLFVEQVNFDGVYVSDAGRYGLFVNQSGNSAIYVGTANADALYVSSAGFDGVDVDQAGDNGIESSGATDFAATFTGNVLISGGTCTGCLFATFAVNDSDTTLLPGDLVTVGGVRASDLHNSEVLMRVRRAAAGETVVGVVRGVAEVKAIDSERESGLEIVPREGAVKPGEYLTIITHGVTQVRASGSVAEGARLTVGEVGQARMLQERTLDGMIVVEGAPTVGIALEAEPVDGLIWALVNPQ